MWFFFDMLVIISRNIYRVLASVFHMVRKLRRWTGTNGLLIDNSLFVGTWRRHCAARPATHPTSSSLRSSGSATSTPRWIRSSTPTSIETFGKLLRTRCCVCLCGGGGKSRRLWTSTCGAPVSTLATTHAPKASTPKAIYVHRHLIKVITTSLRKHYNKRNKNIIKI